MGQMAPFVILLLATFSTESLASSTFHGARVGMRHIDSGGNFTKDELIARSAFRLSRLSLQYGSGEYIIDLSIGTPKPQLISGIADTGSSIIWTQCYNCNRCFKQPTPLYDPRKSQSYSTLPCNSNLCLRAPNADPTECCSYSIIYGSGKSQGHLISDTFLLGDNNPVSVPNIVFGCATSSMGIFDQTTGIIGLSRSKYSLITQLGINKFSYCLHPDTDAIHPMFLGSAATLQGPFQSTPFVAPHETHYYVNLTGISLGSKLLPIPQTVFQFNPSDRSGGVIIDSGTPLTRLAPQAFQVVSQALKEIVNQPIDNSSHNGQLCFSLPSGSSAPSMPDMIFHFDGANLEVTGDKYMHQRNDGMFCLLILQPPRGFTQSVIGTFQMQNVHILYDLNNNMLSFAQAECAKL